LRHERHGCHLDEGGSPPERAEDAAGDRKCAERSATQMPDDGGVGQIVERLDEQPSERREGERDDAAIEIVNGNEIATEQAKPT
jgi:hypothetical protein